jgi:4-amino-4-deoxy-L-arabinose transferase-like glycosyltransferase
VFSPSKGAAALFSALLLSALYLYDLTGAGVLSADEPRYASIARQMAMSGDWVTPRLWHEPEYDRLEPWFEKPALIYWMTAAGFKLGLNADWAPRLPVALVSIAFLIAFGWILAGEFGRRAAWFSTVVLATSAGWLGFSHVAVPDVPMTASFTLAMVLCFRWLTGKASIARLTWAAALIGVAVFAKGLVPLALSAPLVWMGRRRLLELLQPRYVAVFLAVAAPWYVACAAVNGKAFLVKFFIDHHVGRYTTNALLHEQPWWFYLPVIVGAAFPWIPALPAILRRFDDPRRRLLFLWIGWGLLFFSLSTNKLPGYMLPLLPPLAILIGLALDELRNALPVLIAMALLMAVIPALVTVLPQALAHGLSRSDWPAPDWTWAIPVVAIAPVWYLERHGKRSLAIDILALLLAGGVVVLKTSAFPAIDANVSARPLWKQIEPVRDQVCVVEPLQRHWRYGLNYYSVKPLPDCEVEPRPMRVEHAQGDPPVLRQ